MGNCCSNLLNAFSSPSSNGYESINEQNQELINSQSSSSSSNKSGSNRYQANDESYNNKISSKMSHTSSKESESKQQPPTQSMAIPIANNNTEHNSPSNLSPAETQATSHRSDLSTNSNKSGKSGSFHLKYELKEEVGVGSTSKCYRCLRKSDGKEFACKVIDKRQVEVKFTGLLDQFYVEIKVLESLHHPNIIKLEDTFETNDRLYVIMEMMKGGELFDYVVEKGTLSEEEASILIRKITSAVAHMHSQNIIHRDLKPENLLLTNKDMHAEVKLIDFGLAKVMCDDPVASSFLGTKGYLAPEMLQRHSYDKAIDMWALGVIAFVLLCGCLPFDDDSSRITSESAARKKFTLRFPKWAASLSASAKDLLHNLLEIDPKRRYTADQALNHPWVSGKTVQLNNYLQSPCILGEKKREMRSPLPPGYIQNTHDRAQGGPAATARATYNLNQQQYYNDPYSNKRAANPGPTFDSRQTQSSNNQMIRKNSI